MNEGIIAVSAAVGALTLGVLGWLSSGEAFQVRKFLGTFITAIVSGITVAVTYNYTQGVGVLVIFTAFLTGAGVDASRKAIANLTIK